MLGAFEKYFENVRNPAVLSVNVAYFHLHMTASFSENEPHQIAFRLRVRDIACIQMFVERFQHRLVRYLVYLLGRRDGFDDLVQERWLRVLEHGASYDGRSRSSLGFSR